MASSSNLRLSINTTAASSTLPSTASCSTATTPRYSLSSPATSSTTSMLEPQSSSWPATPSSSSSPTTVPHTMWSLLDQVQAEANKNHNQQQNTKQQQVFEGGEPSEAALGTDAGVGAVTGRRGRGRKRVGPNCMVCKVAASNVLLRPCNHLVLCAGCSEIAETSGSDCPWCLTAVREYLLVHRS